MNHASHLKYKNIDFKHAESQARYQMSDEVMNKSNILPDTPKNVSTLVFSIFVIFTYVIIYVRYLYQYVFLSIVISLEMRQSHILFKCTVLVKS